MHQACLRDKLTGCIDRKPRLGVNRRARPRNLNTVDFQPCFDSVEIVAVSWITFDSIPGSCQDPFPFRGWVWPFSNWANIGERGAQVSSSKALFTPSIARWYWRGWGAPMSFRPPFFRAEDSWPRSARRVSACLELPYICNLNPSLFWLRPGRPGNWEMNTVRAPCSRGDKWKYRVAILQVRV